MNQMRDHNDYTEPAWVYALGALDGQDKRDFEAHLSICPACQKELMEAERVTARLAQSVAPAGPPPTLRQKILSRIAAQVQPAFKVAPRRTWWPRLAVGFGLASLLLAFVGWWKALDLNRQVLALQEQIQTMQGQIVQQANDLALLRSPATEMLTLAGQEVTPEAQGKVIWDKATGSGLFLAAGLPVPPGNKTYQLWVIADQKPVSAGIFAVDSQGQGEVRVANLPPSDSIQAFAVTLEPAGGVPQPTGEKYLVGAIPKT